MDLPILQALRDKRRFKSLLHAVPVEMLSTETQVLLQWYAAYWETYPEHDRVDSQFLQSLIKVRCVGVDPTQVALALQLAQRALDTPEDRPAVDGLVSRLYELDFSGRAGALLAAYTRGEEIDLAFEVQQLASATRRAMVAGSQAAWASQSILECLQEDSDDGGLQWTTFKHMQLTMKGLHIGDNVAVCAPTDKGKTSLLCRFAVDFQRQAKLLYPGRPLLYLVNEGRQERIKIRMWQTELGMNREQMFHAATNHGVDHLIAEAWGGTDMIRIADIHGKSLPQICNIISQHNPHMVITDMTGRIRAPSNKGGGMNDIGQLEEVWNGIREDAVIQQYAHMGTVQVSAEGFDMLYPPISALQNSKTGIQTTLDMCLMMGALVNPTAQFLRGISTPKNKLARSGANSLVQFEAVFNPNDNTWRS